MSDVLMTNNEFEAFKKYINKFQRGVDIRDHY